MLAFVNSSVTLALKLDDGDETLHPQAKVYDSEGNLDATVNLTHETSAIYTGQWNGSANIGEFIVDYLVYTDVGHANQSDDYNEVAEHILISQSINDIYADTNELQQDWTDGGRLDLILDEITVQGDTNETKIDIIDGIVDAILIDTGTTIPGTLTTIEGKIDTIDGIVDAIIIDTAEIGVAGAGLSNIPWNASWDAEVQSECADALNVYDPPTRAEATTDKNEIITQVNANETKIDIIDGIVDAILVDTAAIDWTDVEFIRNIEGGRWIRDGTQMKFYEDDNVSLVATFNLKKADGSPAGESDDVYERTRV